MEINLTDKQKIILEGFIRSCIFLVIMRELYLFLYNYIIVPLDAVLFNSINIVFNKPYIFLTKNIALNEFNEALGFFLTILFSFLILIISNTYIIAKFCGLFKYFSQFRFWKSFSILLAISFILNHLIANNIHILPEKYIADDLYIPLTIIPSYLVFIFFNFLTKKFPTPFKQIGYVFSLKCYINLFKKFKSGRSYRFKINNE